MRNIRRIREGQRLTYVELSERLASVGRPIPVLGLRRIERGERRVDVDDLLALAYALGVPPVDLLIPSDLLSDAPYGITSEVTTVATLARNWIRGDAWLPDQGGEQLDPFGLPLPTAWETVPTAAIQWMPRGRADAVMQELLTRSSTPMPEAGKERNGRSNQDD